MRLWKIPVLSKLKENQQQQKRHPMDCERARGSSTMKILFCFVCLKGPGSWLSLTTASVTPLLKSRVSCPWLCCCCCCCLSPGIPGDCTQSKQILRRLQLFSAGAFPASKQVSAWKSRGEVHVLWQLTWAEEGSLFFRAGVFPDGLVEKKVLYDGFLWKCFVKSEFFPAV